MTSLTAWDREIQQKLMSFKHAEETGHVGWA
jgi:hypothetical protein